MNLFVATFDQDLFTRLVDMFEDCAPGGSSGVRGGRLLWLFTEYDQGIHDEMLKVDGVLWTLAEEGMTISDCINKLAL